MHGQAVLGEEWSCHYLLPSSVWWSGEVSCCHFKEVIWFCEPIKSVPGMALPSWIITPMWILVYSAGLPIAQE